MQAPDEAALVREAREGGRSAFAELVRRHHPAILALCRSMLNDPAEADDAAQEAFLKAWRSLADFSGGSGFGTWLYRIASNQCLDLLRSRARRKAESLEELVERDAPALERALGPSAQPLDRLEAGDLAARLLAGLPEEQRLALVLRETEGLRYDEIAKVMGCSVDSVKARLKRARQALGESLRHFSTPEDV
ncbi:MAG: sigma-70 family RNA polymerase sigma factor [Elusimicrobia bacterium]|nr:sigma-70 family RNA polymerase sigma factor [Elusimicrobiota bacterium]